MMSYSQLRVERQGGVIVCGFDNPPEGYMDNTTVEELDRFTAEVEADAAARAVVFRGVVPGVFIRHYTVHGLGELSERLRADGRAFDPARIVPERQIDRVFARLGAMPQVTIAAMNGLAMGGGFEFCLACDIRVGEDGPHTYGLPEVNVGILPGAGGTQRLTRTVGPGRAMEMILQGRVITPREAEQYGIVQELAMHGGAVDRALAIARRTASLPPLAVAHSKRLVQLAMRAPLDEGLARERTLFLDTLISDDAARLMGAMNRGERDIRD